MLFNIYQNICYNPGRHFGWLISTLISLTIITMNLIQFTFGFDHKRLIYKDSC